MAERTKAHRAPRGTGHDHPNGEAPRSIDDDLAAIALVLSCRQWTIWASSPSGS